MSIIFLCVSAISAAQSNHYSGLLLTPNPVRIVAYVFIESSHPDSLPGYYQRIDYGEWERSYSFKMGTYRDITLVFYEGKKQCVVKTFEPGWDENFHTIDIKVGDHYNWLTYKTSALSSTSFRKLSIRTKNK